MRIQKFTQEIIQNIMDNQIEKIIFDSQYNSPLPNLPDSVKIIMFGSNDYYDNFNLDEVTDSQLECLFGINDKFNQPIDNLPSNLTHLLFSIGSKFNQPINNLPSTLKYLSLCDNFTHPLDNLPENLKYLYLYSCNHGYNDIIFNYNLDSLPAGLKYFQFNTDCHKCEFNNLPVGLEYLILDIPYIQKFNNLPSTLKYFDLKLITDNLKYSMFHPDIHKYIDIDNNYDKNLINNLPNSLEELFITSTFLIKIESLPSSIKNLKIDGNYLDKTKSLSFFTSFYLLPNSIENLELLNFRAINLRNLPYSIIKLKLFYCSNFNIDDIELSSNLKHLDIYFNENIKEINILPKSLEYLQINDVKINNIPPNLKTIKTNKDNKYIENYLQQKPDLIIEY